LSSPQINATITGISYKPFLCRSLNSYKIEDLETALESDASFILEKPDKIKVVISWWVSAKRTRSYPYARVYDTLNFSGKKVTIIPVFKDEGFDGDRDFIQWDTISLMSLLGVYVIVCYYKSAEKNPDYKNKITKQRFDISLIQNNLNKICSYQSDALHWNLEQAKTIPEVAKRALSSYDAISNTTGVKMHSKDSAYEKIQQISKNQEEFMTYSRELAEEAQNRESKTIQPKENLSGIKAKITITNYLGGKYYFTSDEIVVKGNRLFLVEGKHSSTKLPSTEDIKDGLVKMILFSNLKGVRIDSKEYESIAVLKLTSGKEDIVTQNEGMLDKLKEEAKHNKFQVIINDEFMDLS